MYVYCILKYTSYVNVHPVFSLYFSEPEVFLVFYIQTSRHSPFCCCARIFLSICVGPSRFEGFDVLSHSQPCHHWPGLMFADSTEHVHDHTFYESE